MKTRNKVLLLMLCVVLLAVSSVIGTMAYLTSSDSVTNTFTVGKVKITLDEAEVNTDGTYVQDVNQRVETNEYHLLPGYTYIKDPTIHVDKDSEDCWLFVKVVDALADIQDKVTVADQMTANDWSLVSGTTNIYAYARKASAGEDVIVFQSFKIKGDVDNATLAAYEDKEITVTAYAVQADGLGDAVTAWISAGLE